MWIALRDRVLATGQRHGRFRCRDASRRVPRRLFPRVQTDNLNCVIRCPLSVRKISESGGLNYSLDSGLRCGVKFGPHFGVLFTVFDHQELIGRERRNGRSHLSLRHDRR